MTVSLPGAAPLPAAHTPLARILDHEASYWTTVATIEQRASWALFYNPAFPGRYDPNHAGVFRAAAGTGAQIAAEISAFYRERGLPPVAYVDALATPVDLADCLLRAGFREPHGADWYTPTDLMLYIGPDTAQPSVVMVQVAEDADQQAAWASLNDDEEDAATRALLERLALHEIADSRVTAYLALVDGQPAGRCLRFSTDGLCRIESVLTAAAFRQRGVAAAVLRQALSAALAAGEQLIYLYASQGGAAQRLYERLGFRTIARNVMRVFVAG